MSKFWTDKPAYQQTESNVSIVDLKTWVEGKAAEQPSTTYVLAHFLDGINWGRLDDGKLTVSHQFAPDYAPVFRVDTLVELRVFGEKAEYHLWRDGDGKFVGRWLIDSTAETESDKQYTESYDESQILWGTDAKSVGKGFWRMQDGEQGLVHVIPFDCSAHTQPIISENPKRYDKRYRPLRLKIRHYVKHDKLNPDARVVVSRLISLSSEPKPKGGQK